MQLPEEDYSRQGKRHVQRAWGGSVLGELKEQQVSMARLEWGQGHLHVWPGSAEGPHTKLDALLLDFCYFLTRDPVFSFSTGHHRLCSWSWWQDGKSERWQGTTAPEAALDPRHAFWPPPILCQKASQPFKGRP